MKKRRFCAEEIQEEAVKCRFCGEFLDEAGGLKPKPKWYYSTPATVISLLVLGPFGLPLVWKNPKYKVVTKVVVTITIIGITVGLCHLLGQTYQRLMDEVNALGLH